MIRLFLLLCVCVVGVLNLSVRGKIHECGVEASPNPIHQNPWLVYLEYWREDTRTDIRCAATLVDSQNLITAAHCIRTPKFSRIIARLGEYDLSKQEDCVSGVCADPVIRIEVEDIYVHPSYDGSSHDVAVLKLAKPAPFTDFIRPVCLPSSKLRPNSVLAATGWGEIPLKGYYSSIKKKINLPLWDQKSCETVYKNHRVQGNIICAGGQEGIDTCRGDSGGPLVLAKDKIEVYGITSSGKTHCGTKDFPGFYTSILDHLNWIERVISSNK